MAALLGSLPHHPIVSGRSLVALSRDSVRTTRRDPEALRAPDLVNRRFAAETPDHLWLADITYVPTGQGFLLSSN